MSKNDVIRQLVDALAKVYKKDLHDDVLLTEVVDAKIAGEAELAKPEPEPEPLAHIHRTSSNIIEVYFAGALIPADGGTLPKELVSTLPINKSVPLYTTPPEPEGWKLVPVEPTDEQWDAAYEAFNLVWSRTNMGQDQWESQMKAAINALSSAPDYKGYHDM